MRQVPAIGTEPYFRALQTVRVLDVVAIGPAMIWASVVATRLPLPVRVFLGIAGFGTILFNYERWRNARL